MFGLKPKPISKIIPGLFKYVIVTPWGTCYGTRREPKKIPGGYLTNTGRRFISNSALTHGRIRCIPNDYQFL